MDKMGTFEKESRMVAIEEHKLVFLAEWMVAVWMVVMWMMAVQMVAAHNLVHVELWVELLARLEWQLAMLGREEEAPRQEVRLEAQEAPRQEVQPAMLGREEEAPRQEARQEAQLVTKEAMDLSADKEECMAVNKVSLSLAGRES